MRSDQQLPINKRIIFNSTLQVKHNGNVAGVVGASLDDSP
jgi:hypothetical protein